MRETPQFRTATAFYEALLEPGSGLISDAADVAVSPDGATAVFTASVQPDLASPPDTHIAAVDLGTGTLRRLSDGPRDRLPRYSPDGTLAYLRGTGASGRYELVADGHEMGANTDGSIEYFEWSPDGSAILLGVAGLGADLSGAQGGTKIATSDAGLPAWLPTVETDTAEDVWRRAWIFDVDTGDCRPVSPHGLNVWEATWQTRRRIAAVASEHHGEGAWYTARLVAIDVTTGAVEELYRPAEQMGWPAASPEGRLAFVEAICSDRWIVAGTVTVLEADGTARSIDSNDVDVTWLGWLDSGRVAFAGHRGLETVVGVLDVEDGTASDVWASEDRTIGLWYPRAATTGGGFCVVGEAYDVAPELAIVSTDGYRPIRSFAPSALADPGFVTGRIESVVWTAPDGLEIQGHLVRAPGPSPGPVVMNIHGGPIWCHRNRWLGRQRGTELLVRAGVSVFLPNPRGSSGRGQEFAGMVRGDMGGADTYDYLTGLDALVASGVADPARIGVTGISYGGFMSAWLITRDARFAAAVVISPVSDWYSQHRTSQIPFFDELFLEPGASTPGGLFFERSPAFFADRVTCPTLVVAGDLDMNTPPGQAVEFYRSLVEHGVPAALVRYPAAGHGARQFPENVDVTARILDWFRRYL